MYQYQVTFTDAVRRGFENYCGFTGRASRSEYWWWCLFTFVANIVLSYGLMIFGAKVGVYASYLFQLAILLPSLALGVRRLHDIGKSGWWFLINLIPLVGNIIFIVWACKESQPTPNEYGEVPNLTAQA